MTDEEIWVHYAAGAMSDSVQQIVAEMRRVDAGLHSPVYAPFADRLEALCKEPVGYANLSLLREDSHYAYTFGAQTLIDSRQHNEHQSPVFAAPPPACSP